MAKLIPYLAIVAGLLLAALALPDTITALQIADQADGFVSTRATLLYHRAEAHGQGPDTQEVKFKYTVAGQTYEGDNYWTRTSDTEADIKTRIRKEKNGTQTLLIYYSPKRPSLAIIRPEVDLKMPLAIIAVTAILFLGGGLSLASGRKRKRMIARNLKRD